MEKAGYKMGLIGTTGNMIGQEHLHSNLTTPDPIDLHRCFRQMVDAGVQAVSMEVSAHAIAMHRLDGLTFEAAGYTNLSQDHLDYFHTMQQPIPQPMEYGQSYSGAPQQPQQNAQAAQMPGVPFGNQQQAPAEKQPAQQPTRSPNVERDDLGVPAFLRRAKK